MGLANALTFDFPASMIDYKASVLTGIDNITSQQIYAESTPTETWHYYLLQYKNAPQSTPSVNAKGFTLLDKKMLKGTLTKFTKTTKWNETTCQDTLLEDGQQNCTTIENTLKEPYLRFDEDNKWEVKILAIKTRFGQMGKFNPDVSACGNLTSAGTYTLNTSIEINGSTCLTVSAANVTLDCAGYSVTGNNTTGTYGIYSNQANTAITNCQVSNFDVPIFSIGASANITNSAGTTTSFTYASPAYSSGIYVSGANSQITNSNGTSVKGMGIRVTGAGAKLTSVKGNSTLSSCIRIQNAENATITNSQAIGYNAAGFHVDASPSATITNATTINTANGIYFGLSGNSQVRGTNITTLLSNSGIYASQSSNITVDCNGGTITGNNTSGSYGICTDRTGIYISNCNIDRYDYAVRILANSTVTNVNGSGLGANGALAMYGANNTIDRSNFTSPVGIGCYAESTAAFNNLINNSACDGKGGGLHVNGAYNTTVTNSLLRTNATYSAINCYSSGSGKNIANNVTLISTGAIAIFTQSNALCSAGWILANSTINGSLSPLAAYGLRISAGNFTGYNLTMLGMNTTAVFFEGGGASSLDCAGASITGTNKTSTYGVSFGAAGNVSNCNISNFYSSMVAAAGAIITNNTMYGTYYRGIDSVVSGCQIANNTITSADITIRLSGNGTNLTGNTLTTTGGSLYSTIYSTATSANITGNRFNNQAGSGIAGAGAKNHIVTNNTFMATSGRLIDLDATSSNNTFYWNNFTGTTGAYIRDLNGSNYYNTTEGNIWGNVADLSVDLRGNVPSSAFPSLYVATYPASSLPYNNSTSLGKFSCNFNGCGDYKPLTPTLLYYGNLTLYANPAYGGNVTGNLTNQVMPATVQINSTPAWKYVFGSWGTTCASINNSSAANTTVQMTGSCSATASFNLTTMPGITVTSPLSWLLAYYMPNSSIWINWTNTSTIYGAATYNVSLYNYTGTYNTTINSSTNATSQYWNSTPYLERWIMNVTACDPTGWCTSNTSTFLLANVTLTANYSAFASTDGVNVAHDFFVEYCDFTCYPNYTCNQSKANLTLTGGVLYSNLTNSTYNGSATFNFTSLGTATYFRQCGIENIYGNTSNTGVRSVNILGKSIAEVLDLGLTVASLIIGGIMLIWMATQMKDEGG